jgi:hypothetical protein
LFSSNSGAVIAGEGCGGGYLLFHVAATAGAPPRERAMGVPGRCRRPPSISAMPPGMRRKLKPRRSNFGMAGGAMSNETGHHKLRR